MKDCRVFKTKDKNSKELVYKFVRPSQAVQSKAELVRRAKYSEALRAGALLGSEVAKILKDRNMWGDEQEKQAAEIRARILKHQEELKDPALSNDAGKVVVENIRAARIELNELTGIISDVASNTCDNLADEERNQFYASECIYDNASGAKVYKSLEDFRNRLDDPSTIDSYRETVVALLEVVIGKELPSDLQSEYAENKWLTERGLLNKETPAAEATPIAEEAPKGKKKKQAE